MKDLKKRIEESLKGVIDPETEEDVVSMGLIKELEVFEDGRVSLKFRPSAPICPLGFKLAFDIKEAISEVDGVCQVDLEAINFIYADQLNKLLREESTGKG